MINWLWKDKENMVIKKDDQSKRKLLAPPRLDRLPVWVLRKIVEYLNRIDRLNLVKVGGTCSSLMNYLDFRNSLIPKLNELPLPILKQIADQLTRLDLFNLLDLGSNCAHLTNYPEFVTALEPGLGYEPVQAKVTETDFENFLIQRQNEMLGLKNSPNLRRRCVSNDVSLSWTYTQLPRN